MRVKFHRSNTKLADLAVLSISQLTHTPSNVRQLKMNNRARWDDSASGGAGKLEFGLVSNREYGNYNSDDLVEISKTFETQGAILFGWELWKGARVLITYKLLHDTFSGECCSMYHSWLDHISNPENIYCQLQHLVGCFPDNSIVNTFSKTNQSFWKILYILPFYTFNPLCILQYVIE